MLKQTISKSVASNIQVLVTDLRLNKKTFIMTFRFLLLLAIFLPSTSMLFAQQNLEQQLFNNYEQYKEQSIQQLRFKHKDIVPLVEKLGQPFTVVKAGQSIEKRDIYLIKAGRGPIKVLLWSQMHGDEATATMALMDIFNFFSARGDGYDQLRAYILDNLTLYFVPMLNPDGAEEFKRRNAINIDLNRDAIRLQSPEARLLKQLRDGINADWGFNLHDQNDYYGVGVSNKNATFSFLAPAYNYEKDINDVRGRSMQMIGLLNQSLEQFIPGRIGKYNDDFEPRAFGDNIQKWGTSTILVECGYFPNDPEKQHIRKLHFVMLIKAFEAIASGSYKGYPLSEYDNIPFNESNAFSDLIIRNVQYEYRGKNYTIDLAWRRSKIGSSKYYYKGWIKDMGDLSIFHGHDNFDGSGYTIKPGQILPKTMQSQRELDQLQINRLWRNGYLAVRTSGMFEAEKLKQSPIFILENDDKMSTSINPGKNPGLLLQKHGETHYVVVNGFIYDVREPAGTLMHWINK